MTRIRHQRKLTDKQIAGKTIVSNITATGDELQTKPENTIRIAFQNIHGVTDLRGHAVPSEIEAMDELDIDIMGMAETNKPWLKQQKDIYDSYMQKRFQGSRTIYTAAPTKEHNLKYQPGGNLLTANGEITARIDGYGSDKWGRYCWYTLRGRRDEGIIIIVAYRVCHETSSNPGPHTAFQQQYVALRNEGIAAPNPRQQILTDIATLIDDKRGKGYRPILLIDANGDYRKGKDKALSNFISRAKLRDPYVERFPDPIRTYLHGPNRIDYIFMDGALVQSIQSIGYLGTHDGAVSDHVMAYVDMDATKLWTGLIHRPPRLHSREILIEQEDKVQTFLRALRPQFEARNFDERVAKLAKAFVAHKASPTNIVAYNKIYGEFLEIVRGVAKSVGKKKYGYMRSRPLATAGSQFLAARYLLDCKTRGTPPTKRLLTLGERLSIDVNTLLELSERELRQRLRKSRQNLWECQKQCESLRAEWLATEARSRAQAAGDPDWEGRLKNMQRQSQRTAVNRKLTAITKGTRGALTMIQTPNHDWFHSEATAELYHYNKGVFDAYPQAHENRFYLHHTRRVLPDKVLAVTVEKDLTEKYWMITTIIPLPSPLWQDITQPERIEQCLLQRNQKHLEQTALEGGVSTLPPFTLLREDHGFNDMSRKVLAGEPITEYTLTPTATAFFQALRQTEKEKNLTPVMGYITSADVQEMFKRSKERTSSDSRTLNYTLWKCLAKNEKIAGFLSILLSLPFVYGFPNSHWTHMTDFMLEKKPGVRQIHTLRIIGKVAAEFNTCLKFLIGKLARDNFEKSDACDEQHGFRPHRSAPDAMMLKLMTFESARMQKCTIGSLQHDMTAHFDRMYPEMTAIYATKYAVSENVMKSIGATILHLRRNVETALGISQDTYGQEVDAPRLGGMVQGKADVPQLSTQQSDILLKAHNLNTYGVDIKSPGLHRSITHNSIAFADDTEGQVSCDTTENISIPRIVRKLQHSGQTWNDLSNICGGSIAHHKCLWQLLSWEMRAGHLQPKTNNDHRLILQDGKGAGASIQYRTPNEPNVGLGFNICPSGNQRPHYEATLEKIKRFCGSASCAYLTEGEAKQLVTQRLVPKLSYALHGTDFSHAWCNRINSHTRATIVPMWRLNRNFPSAILYGPTEFGGIEFPDAYTLQDQVQLDYLVKQLRWNKSVANAFLVALDSVQICTGLTTPILENMEDHIGYLEQSYIMGLRHRLIEMKAFLWIENSWTPVLQRIGDKAIMEGFMNIPNITTAALRQANAVRLYLRIVSLADITDIGGTFIPADMFNGEWQAGSDLKWPYQPCPPPLFWRTFRSCMRKAFCTRTPPYQRACHSMELDQQLGEWLPVSRNTWYEAYRTQDAVLWRKTGDETLHVLQRATAPGFFEFSHTTTTLPLESFPVKVQIMGDTAWTHRQFSSLAHKDPGHHGLPPGHIIEDTISDNHATTIILGSDGSAHLQTGVATCAWVLHQAEGQHIKACYSLENISSLSSYRSELEGMYRGLKHIAHAGLAPTEIRQWCDNEAAVDRSNRPLYKPGDMIKPDADIVLAIHHTRQQMETGSTIICRHIYGHQDSTKRANINDTSGNKDATEDIRTDMQDLAIAPAMDKTKPRQKPKALNLPATINIECDRIATETATAVTANPNQNHLTPVLSLPYQGSKALLNIGGTWITSHQRRHILRAKWEPGVRRYCHKKFGWEDTTFDKVNWEIIRSARNGLTATQRIQTSKIMYGWLPIMHMQAHITGIKQCPCCTSPDETMDHLHQCPHKDLTEKREILLTKFRKKGLQLDIPRAIMDAIIGTLQAHSHDEVVRPAEHASIVAAVLSQQQIGTHLLFRGFLAKEWETALDDFSVDHSRRKLVGLLKALWIDYTDQIWRNRNEVTHLRQNNTQQAEEQTWTAKLHWFLHNPHVITQKDQFLLNYTTDDIQNMSGRTRKKMVQNLETVQKALEAEALQRAQGQGVITSYFKKIHPPNTG